MKTITLLSKHIDTDKDGSPDYIDCKPLDPTQQHLRPSLTTRKRIESLPYNIVDSKGDPILSKSAVKEDKQNFLRMIKRHPTTIGHLERSPRIRQLNIRSDIVDFSDTQNDTPYGFMRVNSTSSPTSVYINKPIPRKETNAETDKIIDKYVAKNTEYAYTNFPSKFLTQKSRDEYYEHSKEELTAQAYRHPYYKQSQKRKVRQIAKAQASTLHHELTHVSQFRHRRQEMLDSFYNDPYFSRWHETQAQAESKRIMKYYKPKKVTPTLINYTFNLADHMDVDRDGVPDSKDCKPLDPKRQHIILSPHVDKTIKENFPGKYNPIELGKMLSYPRPSRSKMEDIFIHKYIDSIPKIRHDSFGNRMLRIGDSSTVFTSHTDTVHRKQTTKKLPVYIQGKWAKTSGKEILGADDTTGVWLMLNLIGEEKPGHYIFHRDEELGRFGSKFIAEHRPQILSKAKRVISFDRYGYGDIITHQLGYRTASDEFAKTFARKLGGDYKPSRHGSFTDSYSYRKIVPECTNVSVGFDSPHSVKEKQNLRFAQHLYKQIKDIDFEKLPTKRDPTKTETSYELYNPILPGWNYSKNDDYYSWFNKEIKRR